jgi:hypothetical protein
MSQLSHQAPQPHQQPPPVQRTVQCPAAAAPVNATSETSRVHDVGLPRLPPQYYRRVRDHCTMGNATALAARLTRWWHERGFTNVAFWVVEEPIQMTRRGEAIWLVRSNLVGGLPPEAAPDDPKGSVAPAEPEVPPLSVPVRANPATRQAASGVGGTCERMVTDAR